MSSISQPPTGQPPSSSDPAPPLIEFENVSVQRGETIALDRLSLQIGVGEHVAILGPNGCGKSTLIKLITRECYPLVREASSIRIMGREAWNVVELRKMLGIVTSDLMTMCTREATGREIAVSGYFSSIGVWPHQQVSEDWWAEADAALKLMEVSYLADRFTEQMSSGEARRVLIARALVHRPKALILDEPSTALDLFAQHELRETLRKLAAQGTGIVMVTHHLSDLIPEMDRIILMSGGQIAADGPKQEILTEQRLAKLFGLPLDLAERNGYYNLW